MIRLLTIGLMLVGTSLLAAEPEKVKWDASADMAALAGQWKMTSEVYQAGFDRYAVERGTIIGEALCVKDSRLAIDGGAFKIGDKPLQGKVTNAHNEIEFVPAKWWNTHEPKLKFTLPDGTVDSVSYIVHDDVLQVRYPANSCSRSGLRLTFERVDD